MYRGGRRDSKAEIDCKLLWSWVRSRDPGRLAQAFTALSTKPELCLLVKELEVRVFELATMERLEALQDETLVTLEHTRNLKSLVWTRKGSLRADIMDAICALPSLEKLELNATPAGGWSAAQILNLPRSVKSLSLLLPDREVISNTLPRWLASEDPSPIALASLSIICLDSPVLNGHSLQAISQGLSSLTSLTLIGCNKLRDEDVLQAIKRCGQLRHLAIEAVPISSGFYEHAAPFLPYLESLRTSHPGRRDPHINEYYAGLAHLVESCSQFKSFTHYLSGDTARGYHPQVSPKFINALVQHAGERMVRFEISGLSMALESVQDICLRCRNIEQLVVPVSLADMVCQPRKDVAHKLRSLARTTFISVSLAYKSYEACTLSLKAPSLCG